MLYLWIERASEIRERERERERVQTELEVY